jgi:hypothetical protein
MGEKKMIEVLGEMAVENMVGESLKELGKEINEKDRDALDLYVLADVENFSSPSRDEVLGRVENWLADNGK